jgi:hypothetical protein
MSLKFLKLTDIQKDRIFEVLRKFYKYDQRIKIEKIDFNKPWWAIFHKLKVLGLINLVNAIIFLGVYSTIPIALAYIINQNRLDYLLGYVAILIITRLIKID